MAIDSGYDPAAVRQSWERGKTYEEAARQPLHRKFLADLLFDTFAAHPEFKLQAGWYHNRCGVFFRFVAGNRERHVNYEFDDTLRIQRHSYEDSVVIPVSLDNLREAFATMEQVYLT